MDHKFISAKSFFSDQKKTSFLYKTVWKEGTTTLLHAPREIDKTASALAIANGIAESGRDVLYVNAEERLSGNCNASDNLYVFTPEFESIDDKTDYADLVFNAIEQAVRTTAIRTFVIDSVSRIAALSFGRNASAAYVMKRLVALQVKCRLSILVVANDTTKSANNALLTLVASEIIVNQDKSNENAISEKSETSSLTEGLSIKTADTLSRQQRRALNRRMAKHPDRYADYVKND